MLLSVVVALALLSSPPAPEAALAQDRGRQGAPPQARPAPFVTCTPTTIRFGSETLPSSNPVADALRRSGPGTIVELAPGDYPAFSIGLAKVVDWNANVAGGQRGQPVVVRSAGGARIVPGTGGDTVSIVQEVRCGFVTFENLTIVRSSRATGRA
jgi:hypothetical protein